MENKINILLKFVPEKIACIIIKDFEDYFQNNLSQTDKVLFMFKFENNLTNQELKEIFEFDVNKVTQRLYNRGSLNVENKDGKSYVYSLSKHGDSEINIKMDRFLKKNEKYKEWIIENRKNKVDKIDIKENVKNILYGLLDANIKPDIEGNLFIDMKKLAEHNIDSTDFIYSNFEDAVDLIKTHFSETDDDFDVDRIFFKNIHESEYYDIHKYDRNTKNLIYTKGLVSSKKEEIISKALTFEYECTNPSCNFSQDKLKTQSKIKNCPKCKSAVELIEEKRTNLLVSKITDVDTSISFPIHIYGKKSNLFSLVGLGDEIEVVGHLEDFVEKDNTITKVLIVNNFWSTDYTKALTKEEEKEIKKFLESINNLKEYLTKAFSEYIEKEWIIELFILQQLTRFNPTTKETPINISLMGEPGVGKNELIKIAERFFPNCDAIVGADITDAGYKGTVNRDTGIKEVGMAKKCQGGTIFFNEFDKFIKSNPNGKKAGSQLLNASITEQEIRLNKAGIRIRMSNLDLRHNIIFNPLDEKKNEDRIKYDYMGQVLDKSLLSRMLPIYIGKDKKRSIEVFDLMLKPTTKKNEEDINKYKLLIRYLRSVEINLSNAAKNKLKEIYESLLEKHSEDSVSIERIGQMLIQLCYGYTRLNNKTTCGVNEVKYVYEIYLKALKSVGINLDNLELLFQEHSTAELILLNEIKIFIERELITQGEKLKLNKIEERFKDIEKKEIMTKAINDLKRDGIIIEIEKEVYIKCY